MSPDAACQLLFDLLDECAARGASDLHLSDGLRPYLRIQSALEPLGTTPLDEDCVERMAEQWLSPQQKRIYQQRMTLDLAIESRRGTRFRVNLFRQRGRSSMAIRRIDQQFECFEQLNLPRSFSELAELQQGLVLITGATGSGKSTSLATLINAINERRACHIMTIEDPIEFVHENKQALIRQRELYNDVPTFAAAVRDALREDPDVILVGEMRDVETMRAAVTAAETGHLVFSTAHSGDAWGVIDRMLSLFPATEQLCLREQLARVLQAVVAQRLVPRKDGTGRVPVLEIMRVNQAVANLIRKGEQHQILSVMQTGNHDGMLVIEQSLAELVGADLIDIEEAFRLARDENVFQSRLAMLGKLAAH